MSNNINDEQIDQVIQEAKSNTVINGTEYFNQLKKKDIETKPEVKNEGARLSLGELGSFNCVGNEEIDEVFDKIEEVVFKMKKCMFRISYVNKGQRKFTAELINEKKN